MQTFRQAVLKRINGSYIIYTVRFTGIIKQKFFTNTGMKNRIKAFEKNLPSGKVRLVLNFESLIIAADNLAPDYLSLAEDRPVLSFMAKSTGKQQGVLYSARLPLKFLTLAQNESDLALADSSHWFDVDLDQIDQIWMSVFTFNIETGYPRYLKYKIKKLQYSVEWLQTNSETGKIESVSISRRDYQPPVDELTPDYSLHDIKMSSDLLGRAVKKIDLRTGSALIRFTAEEQRLEPVVQYIAAGLGYDLSKVDKRRFGGGNKKGLLPTHILSLRRVY